MATCSITQLILSHFAPLLGFVPHYLSPTPFITSLVRYPIHPVPSPGVYQLRFIQSILPVPFRSPCCSFLLCSSRPTFPCRCHLASLFSASLVPILCLRSLQVVDMTVPYDMEFGCFITPLPKPLPQWVALSYPFSLQVILKWHNHRAELTGKLSKACVAVRLLLYNEAMPIGSLAV